MEKSGHLPGPQLFEDKAAVVATSQLPELLSELNITLASPDVVLEAPPEGRFSRWAIINLWMY